MVSVPSWWNTYYGSTALDLSSSGSVTGSLAFNGDYDIALVQLEAGHSYQFTAETSASAGIDTYLYLTDSAGYILDYDDDSGSSNGSSVTGNNSLISYSASTTGDYYLVVRDWGSNDTGSLTLSSSVTYDPPTAAPPETWSWWSSTWGTSATSLSVGGSASAGISFAGDYDAGQVSLTGRTVYEITVDGSPGSISPVVGVYDSSGELVSSLGYDSNYATVLYFTPSSSDDYYIVVNDSGNDSSGTFTYTVSEFGTPTVLSSGADSFSMTTSGALSGADGSDQLVGSSTVDIIYGNTENDTVSGGDGADVIFLGQNNGPASAHPDLGTVRQREGTEYGYGGNGNDVIYGNFGGDQIEGGDGNDTLYGGQDSDTLIGGAGEDILFGNRDNDTLSGGTGADDFIWNPSTGGSDVITDFSVAEADQIGINSGSSYTVGTSSDGYVQIQTASGPTLTLIGVTDADAVTASIYTV